MLRNTRQGRVARTLDDRYTTHLVLRSSRAQGQWAFTRKENRQKIKRILSKFCLKYEMQLHALGIVGNHLHIHLKIGNQKLYNAFIRAITSALAMAITGVSRWNKKALIPSKWAEIQRRPFWDHRPYTKIVYSIAQFLNLKNYIEINQIEGLGHSKKTAKWIFQNKREWVQAKLKLIEQMTV